MDFNTATLIASNIVTVLGLPYAMFIFWNQRQIERDNEEKLIYENLSSSYDDVMRIILSNPDLKIWTKEATQNLSEDQEERLTIIFELRRRANDEARAANISGKAT